MNQTYLKKAFEQRAKVLAHVVTGSKNIKVTVSGNQAYRTPGLINLPVGDFSDPAFVSMTLGWIDHELGHEDITDVAVTKNAYQEGKIVNTFRQIIEDVRMEKQRGEKFRGARYNLNRLAELAIDKGLFSKPTDENPASLVTALCLYYGRSKIIGQTCLHDYATLAEQLLAQLMPQNVIQDILAAMDKTKDAKSNADSLDIAREIVKLLEDLDQDDSGDSSDEDSDGSQDDSGDPSDEDYDDSQDDSGDPSNGDSDDPQDDSSNSSSAANKPSMMEALSEMDDEDFHDKLAKLLGESDSAKHDTENGDSDLTEYLSTNMIFDQNKVMESSVDEVAARRISGQVYQAMHKVLFDQVDSLSITRKSGNKIVNRKLVGISAGNLSVFTRRVDQQDISAAITVLVDGSPSMISRVNENFTLMDYANTCALSFSLGLTKSGIANETIYYGDYDDGRYLAYTAKPFGTKPMSKNFGFRPGYGSTPTGEAMMYALNSLALRHENKKMLIVLTDGQPCCINQVKKAREIAQLFNVKVVPIGISTDVVGGFDKSDFVTVNDPTELPHALRNAVKMKLFS